MHQNLEQIANLKINQLVNGVPLVAPIYTVETDYVNSLKKGIYEDTARKASTYAQLIDKQNNMRGVNNDPYSIA